MNYFYQPQTVGSYQLSSDRLMEASGQKSFKYASEDYVFSQATPLVAEVLAELIRLRGPATRNYSVFDVKWWPELKAGTLPAQPGWHLDCAATLGGKGRQERHLLLTLGAGCPTVFLREPESTAVPPRNIPLANAWESPEGRVVCFFREHVHRAQPARFDGPRLLVRLTECDFIQPKSGSLADFTPTRIRDRSRDERR